MARQLPTQDLRRWGNSLGVRLPAAIARQARLHDNQTVELKVVADGVLIRPVQPRLSLAERLASYTPMAGEATAPFHRIPAQASSTSASTAATSPSLR
jgi:antitoxin MazE